MIRVTFKYQVVTSLCCPSKVPLPLPSQVLPIALRLSVCFALSKRTLELSFVAVSLVKQDCMPVLRLFLVIIHVV